MVYNDKLIKNYKYVVGIDEAGRGPIAGPVVVAGVIFQKKSYISGLNDSKQLSHKKRKNLAISIINLSLDYCIIVVNQEIIHLYNILGATMYGVEKVIKTLSIKPSFCLIDGNKKPKSLMDNYGICVVKGDEIYASIAAASILAKVTRDKIMDNYHQIFPQYNFCKNKGYPTKEHIKLLSENGISPIHRIDTKPVKNLLEKS